MELSQGLVKKYVFYNSGLFNKKTGIELMLLNFALMLYAGFIYRNLIFLITICIGGMLNAIGAIIFLSKNSFFWHNDIFWGGKCPINNFVELYKFCAYEVL